MLCCCNIHRLLKISPSPMDVWNSTVGHNINISCVYCVFAILAVFLQYRLCFCNVGCVFAIFISLPAPPHLRCLVFHGRSQYQHKSAHLLHTTRHSMCFSPLGIYPRGISIEAVDNIKRFTLGFLAPQVL